MTKTGRPKQRIEVRPNRDIVIIGWWMLDLQNQRKWNLAVHPMQQEKFSTYRIYIRRNTAVKASVATASDGATG
jgi:hypothetical protein